jgi:hypothetical protein
MQCPRCQPENPKGMKFYGGRRPLIVLPARPDRPIHGVVGPYLRTIVLGAGDQPCRQ